MIGNHFLFPTAVEDDDAAVTKIIDEDFLQDTWKIEKPESILQDYPNTRLAKEFEAGPYAQHKWELVFMDHRREHWHGPEYGLTLRLLKLGRMATGSSKSSEKKSITAKLHVDVLGPSSHIKTFPTPFTEYTVGGDGLTIELFPKKFGKTLEDMCGEDRRLHLRFSLWMHGRVVTLPSRFEKAKEKQERMNREMKSLMDSGDHSDLKLFTATKEFPVHKCILAARSPVFDAMFKADMTESKQSIVNIMDFDNKTIRGMIEYMYTGEMRITKEIALKLYQIADKYEVLGLRDECEEIVIATLEPGNIVETVVVAYQHCKQTLFPKIVRLIKANRFSFRESDGLMQLMASHPDVAAELF